MKYLPFQLLSDLFRTRDYISGSQRYSFTGHTEDHAGSLILAECDGATIVELFHPLGAVGPHAGEQDSRDTRVRENGG
jgi:hypothetical protein